jgi:hypothetical protein
VERLRRKGLLRQKKVSFLTRSAAGIAFDCVRAERDGLGRVPTQGWAARAAKPAKTPEEKTMKRLLTVALVSVFAMTAGLVGCRAEGEVGDRDRRDRDRVRVEGDIDRDRNTVRERETTIHRNDGTRDRDRTRTEIRN